VWSACCLPASAWGPEGHRIIGELAEELLSPSARARVAATLGPGKTLASVSNWADDIRQERPETAPWHYIDIPIGSPRLNMARDCAKRDCVIAKIEDFEHILQAGSGTLESRREALMFLTHFVEDLHQPLHCSDNHDRGGNDVAVEFLGMPTNLHSLWDSGLLGNMGPEDRLLQSISSGLTPGTIGKLSRGDVKDWAEESHHIAQTVVYGRLPRDRFVSKGSPLKLDEGYERAADPVIRLQLQRAAARLAKLLNATLK
jgi:S1/P1 Nuclease